MHEKIRELARRRLHRGDAPRFLDELRGRAPDEPCAGTGLPEAWNRGISSFYELLGPAGAASACSGTACCVARGELASRPGNPSAASPGRPAAGPPDTAANVSPGRPAAGPPDTAANPSPGRPARCLGRCYEGPAAPALSPRPIPRSALVPSPVVLRHLVPGPAPLATMLADYDLPQGDGVLAAVEAAGLRGRGGAAYPTAAKWKVARDTDALDRVVVANGDEGDPGAYVDRLLLEDAPHSVLAGMLACARAIGASRGIVYVRAEYPVAAARMRTAIEEAAVRGFLEGLEVRVLVGAGSYVAGEETALLRSIEGLRAEPSPKPPYPAVRGLYGLPTVVQNVETLSVVPHLARTFAAGVPRRIDSKAICVSGAVARPGVVEVELGTPLRRVLDEGAGGPRGGTRWKMALVGGPLGRVVAARDFDVAMSFDALPGMGHAGVVVLDESVSARALAEHLFEFARAESCGTCAPCRIGTSLLASQRTRAGLERLLATIGDGSLCGFGQGVPRPVLDLLAAFGDEVLA